MPKLVEGQLGIMRMVSYFSKVSRSATSTALRSYVSNVAEQQANYPDQLPSTVQIRPTIEADTGKVVSSVT